MWTETLQNNEKVSIHKEDDFYLIRKIDVKRQMTENCSINRHVISGSIVKLMEVIEDACDNNILDYNILDTEAMNKKQLHTALSRTTKFKYIHAESLKSKYTYNVNNKHEVKSIGHTEYQNGKIYKLNSMAKVYISAQQ